MLSFCESLMLSLFYELRLLQILYITSLPDSNHTHVDSNHRRHGGEREPKREREGMVGRRTALVATPTTLFVGRAPGLLLINHVGAPWWLAQCTGPTGRTG